MEGGRAMRILVVSDTHGDAGNLRKALLMQRKAEVVIHLGDGAEEMDALRGSFPDKMFLQVRGNCDWGSQLPLADEITLEGKKIYYTHGHIHRVKYGYYEIMMAAREKKADIVLFGHTHIPLQEYEGGLYMLNPGSLSGYNATYGYVDITPAGIVTNIVHI